VKALYDRRHYDRGLPKPFSIEDARKQSDTGSRFRELFCPDGMAKPLAANRSNSSLEVSDARAIVATGLCIMNNSWNSVGSGSFVACRAWS
jgi:hypothetical protein